MQIELPVQRRAAAFMPESVDKEKRTIEMVWTTGAKVRRYDFWTDTRYYEELSLDKEHVRMERLNNGAPFLNAHNSYDLGDVIGVVERAWLDKKEGRAVVRFSDREEVEPIWRDVQSGILRNISVGYSVHKMEKRDDKEEKIPTFRAVDWEPMELSAVPIGADAGAGFRKFWSTESICEIVEAAEEVAERSIADPEPLPDIAVVSPQNYELIRKRLGLLRAL